MNTKWQVCLLMIMTMAFSGCSGKHLKVQDDNSLALGSCFPLPCCVSSNAWVPYNYVSPFELAMPEDEAWPLIIQAVGDMPRTRIVEETDAYIHAKCTSRVFRFVDNLEMLLLPGQQTVSVRSSSTIAIFDFGANFWRVHQLRKQLAEAGVIK